MTKYKLQEMPTLNGVGEYLEQKKLPHVEDAPFDYKGRGSHKIWIKKS